MVSNRSRTTLPKGRQLKQEAFQKRYLDEWIEANVEQNKLLSQLTFWKQLLKGTCVSNTAKGLTFSPTKVRKSPDDNLMSLIQCFLLADLRWTTIYPSIRLPSPRLLHEGSQVCWILSLLSRGKVWDTPLMSCQFIIQPKMHM